MNAQPLIDGYRTRATQVSIKRVQVEDREFDQAHVVIGDLHLYCAITGDRQIRLLKRLADDHQTPMYWDAANSERCCRVLDVREVSP
jgi:hypothetical protein